MRRHVPWWQPSYYRYGSQWAIHNHSIDAFKVWRKQTTKETLNLRLKWRFLTAKHHCCWGTHHCEEGRVLGALGRHSCTFRTLKLKTKSEEGFGVRWQGSKERLTGLGWYEQNSRDGHESNESPIAGGEEENGEMESVTWSTMSAGSISASLGMTYEYAIWFFLGFCNDFVSRGYRSDILVL